MSAIEPDGYVTRDGPDYNEYAQAVLDSLQQQGRDFADPDEAEDESRRLAEMLVLDEETLVEKARAAATTGEEEGELIGNVYDGPNSGGAA